MSIYSDYTMNDLKAEAKGALKDHRCIKHNAKFRVIHMNLRVGDKARLIVVGMCAKGCGRDVQVAL